MRTLQLTAVAFALAVAAPAARANVISFAPNADLTAGPTTIAFGGATFTFSALTANPYDPTAAAVAITTGGTGQASTDGFGVDSLVDLSNVYDFASYPSPSPISYSAADDFVPLTDGSLFGYAEVNGPTLVAYGFDSTAGASITVGSVPEPMSAALLVMSLAGMATFRSRARR